MLLILAPFQCTTNLFSCLIDDRYGIEKNERTIKLQSGDFISISNGSDSAFTYTLALSGIDQVELLASIPGITPSKVKKLSLLRNYSPTLKRKIVEGFIREKMKEKYTWKMLIKEFGYETYKKPASNPQDLFNNALEVAQNIPQDFLKSMTDGTVASTATGDVLDTLIQAASTEGAVFVNTALLVSQSVNSRARYVASEIAHEKPSVIFIAGLKNSLTNSDRAIATNPRKKSPLIPQQPSSTSVLPKIGFIKNTKRSTGVGDDACSFWPDSVPMKEVSKKIILVVWNDKAVMNFNGKDIILFKTRKSFYQIDQIQVQLKRNKNKNYNLLHSSGEGAIIIRKGKYSKTIQYNQICDE
jgi:hypothetical protein